MKDIESCFWAKYRILVVFFSTLKMSFHCLLAFIILFTTVALLSFLFSPSLPPQNLHSHCPPIYRPFFNSSLSFAFWQCDYNFPRCGFLFIYPGFVIVVFGKTCKIFSQYFFQLILLFLSISSLL